MIMDSEQWANELDRILRDGDHPEYDAVGGADGDHDVAGTRQRNHWRGRH